jgi:hypothetical protein
MNYGSTRCAACGVAPTPSDLEAAALEARTVKRRTWLALALAVLIGLVWLIWLDGVEYLATL